MSKFHELKQELEECACPECFGVGEWDDAEPGDIYFNTYKCSYCEGTGINPKCGISLDIERG